MTDELPKWAVDAAVLASGGHGDSCVMHWPEPGDTCDCRVANIARALVAADRAAWKRAMEEAAKACEVLSTQLYATNAGWEGHQASASCAKQIRAIPYKEPTP